MPSDKGAPWIINRIDTPGKALDICLSENGTLAYIADSESGLQIIDISDPNTPIIATLDTPGNAQAIEYSGYIYIADGASGIQMIDASDPINPSIIHTISPFYSTYSISVKDKKIFASDLSGMYWLPIPEPPTSVSDWTIMVYMNADNDLEKYSIQDINEMEEIPLFPESTSVIVLIDRIDSVHISKPAKDDTSNGDWDTARIYRITQDEVGPYDPNIRSQLIRDMGELDMADSQTLQNFCTWAMDTYPAKRYSLIIWGHGTGLDIPNYGGFLGKGKGKGINKDETNHKDLYNKDIADAVEALKNNQKRVDVLGFDACLMGTIEVAYELNDLAGFLVFSSEKEPNEGWPYHDILAILTADPDMTGEELSRVIVESYGDYYWDKDQEGGLEKFHILSAISMNDLKTLANAVDELATAILNKWNKGIINKSAIEDLRGKSLEIRGTPRPHIYIDLHYFCTLIMNSTLPSDIKTRAESVARLLEETNIIIERRLGKGFIDSGSGIYPDFSPDPYLGLSIYFPKYDYVYRGDISYNRIAIDFPDYIRWGKLLEKYFEDPDRDKSHPWDGIKCSVNTPGLAIKVKVYGRYAYVVDHEGGIRIIEISNPQDPKPVKSISTPGAALYVVVMDDYAYVLWQDLSSSEVSGLDIFDISQHQPIALASTFLEYLNPTAIYVNPKNFVAYIAYGQGALQEIEIGVSDSGAFFLNPKDTIGIGARMECPPDILVPEGTDHDFPFYMYAVNGYGLSRYEILEKGNSLSSPIKITGSKTTPGSSWDIKIKGDFAYVADGEEGLQIMDIAYPYSVLKIVGNADTPGSALGVCVDGNYAYVADGPEGLQVINVSDPGNPYIAREPYKLENIAYDVFVKDQYAFVACGESGLWIISLEPKKKMEKEHDEEIKIQPPWYLCPWSPPSPYTISQYQFYWPDHEMNYARYFILQEYQLPQIYKTEISFQYFPLPQYQGYYMNNLSYNMQLPVWPQYYYYYFQQPYNNIQFIQYLPLQQHQGYPWDNLSNLSNYTSFILQHSI